MKCCIYGTSCKLIPSPYAYHLFVSLILFTFKLWCPELRKEHKPGIFHPVAEGLIVLVVCHVVDLGHKRKKKIQPQTKDKSTSMRARYQEKWKSGKLHRSLRDHGTPHQVVSNSVGVDYSTPGLCSYQLHGVHSGSFMCIEPGRPPPPQPAVARLMFHLQPSSIRGFASKLSQICSLFLPLFVTGTDSLYPHHPIPPKSFTPKRKNAVPI